MSRINQFAIFVLVKIGQTLLRFSNAWLSVMSTRFRAVPGPAASSDPLLEDIADFGRPGVKGEGENVGR